MIYKSRQPKKEAFKNEDGSWNLVEIFTSVLGQSNMRAAKLNQALRELLKTGYDKADILTKDAIREGIIFRDWRSKNEVWYGLPQNNLIENAELEVFKKIGEEHSGF